MINIATRLLPKCSAQHCVAVLICCAPLTSHSFVYKCTDEHGEVWFSDLGCKGGLATPLETSPIIDYPAPTHQQTPNLKAFERELKAQQQARKKQAQARHRTNQNRKQACDQAKQILQRLNTKRRKGYAIGEATKFKAQINAARRDRQQYCR